ncbi:hypothetical protein [Streptomyces cinnamoneus]
MPASSIMKKTQDLLGCGTAAARTAAHSLRAVPACPGRTGNGRMQ